MCEGFPDGSWWFEPSSLLPPDTIIVTEWTPDATYHFHPDTHDVDIWVHADDSCLTTFQQVRNRIRSDGGCSGCWRLPRPPATNGRFHAMHCMLTSSKAFLSQALREFALVLLHNAYSLFLDSKTC